MRLILLVAALVAAAPATAFQAAPTTPATTPAPIDPARLALATSVVEKVWPLGTYQRMMSGVMGQASEGMMASLYDMRMGDIMPADIISKDEPAFDAETANKTFREIMAEGDPHFQERQRLTNQAMMAGITPVMNRLEPRLREGMARAYARRFTAGQLTELDRFFATPTGALYGTESLMVFVDPEFTGMMTEFVPEMMKEMPAIMKQVEAATAHLPPPPKTAYEDTDGGEDDAQRVDFIQAGLIGASVENGNRLV